MRCAEVLWLMGVRTGLVQHRGASGGGTIAAPAAGGGDETFDDLFAPSAAAAARESRVRRIENTSPLAGEWIEAFDRARGKPYFYHSVTQEVRWNKPK
jgi:hypothetical protein